VILDATPSTLRAPALLADVARGRTVAFAACATIELLERPDIVAVPGMAYYARGLLRWQRRLVPIIDLQTLLRAHADTPPAAPRYALVLAWQRIAGVALDHGAIGLAAPPRRIDVDADTALCPLPLDSDLWPLLAVSCLRDGDQAVPIVDTAALFGSAHG